MSPPPALHSHRGYSDALKRETPSGASAVCHVPWETLAQLRTVHPGNLYGLREVRDGGGAWPRPCAFPVGPQARAHPFQARFPSACEAVGLGQWFSLETKVIINANAQSLFPQRF